MLHLTEELANYHEECYCTVERLNCYGHSIWKSQHMYIAVKCAVAILASYAGNLDLILGSGTQMVWIHACEWR